MSAIVPSGAAAFDLVSLLTDGRPDDPVTVFPHRGALELPRSRQPSRPGTADAAAIGAVISEDIHKLFLEQRQELAGMLKAHFDAQSYMLHRHTLRPKQHREEADNAIETTKGHNQVMTVNGEQKGKEQDGIAPAIAVTLHTSEEPGGRSGVGHAWEQLLPTYQEQDSIETVKTQASDIDNSYNGMDFANENTTPAAEVPSAQRRPWKSTIRANTRKAINQMEFDDDMLGADDYTGRESALNAYLIDKTDSTCLGKVRAYVLITLHGKIFRALLSLVILMNSIFIGIYTHESVVVEFDNPQGQRSTGKFWNALEVAFFVFFTGELILRMWAFRLDFFVGPEWRWNLFDFLLVVQSFCYIILFQLLNESTEGMPNLNFTRILRTLRFGRILRVIRVFKVFQSLRVMVVSIVQSFLQLLWVFLLLLFVIYFFAIIFLHGITEYVKNNEFLRGTKMFEDMRELYGGLGQTITSLFMGICGGKDWSELMDPLMEISVLYGLLFVFYIFFVIFGVLNVVTSIFVDSASQVSKKDRDIVTQHSIASNQAYAKSIRNFFYEADKDGSGTLSWEEFESYLTDEKVQAYFGSLGLDVSQARALFMLLDVDESNSVGIEEFVFGCMRMKGEAKSIDVNMLLYENEKMIFQWSNFIASATQDFQDILQALGVDKSDRRAAVQTLVDENVHGELGCHAESDEVPQHEVGRLDKAFELLQTRFTNAPASLAERGGGAAQDGKVVRGPRHSCPPSQRSSAAEIEVRLEDC